MSLCVCVCVVVDYCQMPVQVAIAISVNLMEPEGLPDNVGKLARFLQTSVMCLGNVLCISGTLQPTGTGFRTVHVLASLP